MGRRDPSLVDSSIAMAVLELPHVEKKWKSIGNLFGHNKIWGGKLLKRYNGLTGLSFEERKKTGRKQKVNANYRPFVLCLAKEYGDWTAKDIAITFRGMGVVDVSAMTMNHVLNDMEIRKTTAMWNDLTPRHKAARLDWCEMMRIALMVKPWLSESWLISDEVRVSLDGEGMPRVHIVRGEFRYNAYLQVRIRLIDCLINLKFFCIDWLMRLFLNAAFFLKKTNWLVLFFFKVKAPNYRGSVMFWVIAVISIYKYGCDKWKRNSAKPSTDSTNWSWTYNDTARLTATSSDVWTERKAPWSRWVAWSEWAWFFSCSPLSDSRITKKMQINFLLHRNFVRELSIFNSIIMLVSKSAVELEKVRRVPVYCPSKVTAYIFIQKNLWFYVD